MRSAKWSRQGAQPLLRHLDRRAQRFRQRTGETPYLVGDIDELYRIATIAPQLRPEFLTIVAQPGVMASAVSEDQLRLLAGTDSYVRSSTGGEFEVYCFP